MAPRKSPALHVCALRHVPDIIAATGARHLISAINSELAPVTPDGVARGRHLKLDMHDIIAAQPGAIPPASRHVLELVEFVMSWDRRHPLLIHCYAGLSRSTAAAFIALCALNSDTPEHAIARALRRSSDTAVPNRLFVALADEALGREGRMTAALESMGPHRVALECTPFGIDALHARTGAEQAHRAA